MLQSHQWVILAVFVVGALLGTIGAIAEKKPGLFFIGLLGIPFLLAGLYCAVGLVGAFFLLFWCNGFSC